MWITTCTDKNHFQDSDVANPREKDAFAEFLMLDQFAIHNMRDHPWHGVYFLAGLFSVKLHQPEIRAKIKDSFGKLMQDNVAFSTRKEKSADFVVLERWHY